MATARAVRLARAATTNNERERARAAAEHGRIDTTRLFLACGNGPGLYAFRLWAGWGER